MLAINFIRRLFLVALLISVPIAGLAQQGQPSIQQLLQEPFLDDYYSNVVYGYEIVTDTQNNASRYVGNSLNCSNCHLQAGTQQEALPLNVAGMYPKWRAKNGKRNGIGLRIRECFLYSMDGIMPPEDAPEVLAISAYISYLSQGQIMGAEPEGRGVPTLPDTGYDPNPATGRAVYLVNDATNFDPTLRAISASPPTSAFKSSASFAERVSFHKSAGRITSPLLSSATIPCC